MKCRAYSVAFNRQEDSGGMSVMKTKTVAEPICVVPTAQNIKAVICLFTDLPIDTRYMSVAEQIRDGLDCGLFSISLRNNEDLVSYSLSFLEV